MAIHRPTVAAVKVRELSDELGCEVSRVVGYRPVCGCGWRGSVRPTVAQARVDAAWHRAAPGADRRH